MRSAASPVASASSAARTRNASCSSWISSVRTRPPRCGWKSTRPIAPSLRSASRMGVRDTPKRSDSCSCRSTLPGSSSPETIASSMASAMSSDLVVSTLTPTRLGLDQPAPDGVARQLDAVAHAELLQDVGAVPLHGLHADHERGRDLLRAVRLGDQLQHLVLARRERVELAALAAALHEAAHQRGHGRRVEEG